MHFSNIKKHFFFKFFIKIFFFQFSPKRKMYDQHFSIHSKSEIVQQAKNEGSSIQYYFMAFIFGRKSLKVYKKRLGAKKV